MFHLGGDLRIALDARDALRRECGITVYTSCLIAALERIDSGDDFIFYVDDYKGPGPADDVFSSCRPDALVRLPGTGAAWKQLRLPLALRHDRVEVFHSLTSTLPLWRPCPTVLTVCDLFHEVYPEHLPPAIQRQMHTLYSFAARHADRIIAISNNTKQDLVKYYGVPETKIAVVFPGVNDFYRETPDPAAVDDWLRRQGIERPYVIHVGDLSTTRNVGGLLEAFAIARKGAPELSLVLVGRPYWGFDAAAIIDRLNLGARVTTIDYLGQTELRLAYTGAAVMVMPSLFEGFGLPVGEAMACGTPVIASSTTSLPEAAGGAGILVDPTDPGAIAEGILRVVGDTDLADDLRRRGLKRVERLTWRATAEQTHAIYRLFA